MATITISPGPGSHDVHDSTPGRHIRPGPRPCADDTTLRHPVGSTGGAASGSQTSLAQHGECLVLVTAADIGDGDMGAGANGEGDDAVRLERAAWRRVLLEHATPERLMRSSLNDLRVDPYQTSLPSRLRAGQPDEVRRVRW
jgi:hypothetical protein